MERWFPIETKRLRLREFTAADEADVHGRAVLERAFRIVNVHRVCATCDTRNAGSWRVMEKLGMRREGRFLGDKLQISTPSVRKSMR